jgi:TonB-linked SusC/RagA family outer membrane protein
MKYFTHLISVERRNWLSHLLLIFFLSVITSGAVAQNHKVQLSGSNITLREAFDQIEKQTSLSVDYDAKTINVKRVISNLPKGASLSEVMTQLLQETNCTFSISGTHIIISTQAQKPKAKKIFGTITDAASNQPIVGSIVRIEGTNVATMTDENGKFGLDVTKTNATISVSFMGYNTERILVNDQTVFNIKLVSTITKLEEVVIVGYGTQKKMAITGAVAQAKVKLYTIVPENNVLESLKGTTAGLNISGTNQAGQVPSITIRGQNSINAGSSPLIVVDGAIFKGSLNDISPSDIESFTVLKDASAAAIYGSRSANGVIIIETKKGNAVSGKPQFNVNINDGTSNQLDPLKIYDGPGYIQRMLDIRQANGLDHDPSKAALYLQNIEATNYNATPDHKPTLLNPSKLFTQIGQAINTTISVSSKTDKTQYYISGNIVDQKGVMIQDAYKHYSARANFESDLTSWFKLGMKAYYSLNSYPGSINSILNGGGSAGQLSGFSPYATLKAADGSYLQFPQTTTSFNSPYWSIPDQIYNRQNNLNGILTAQIKIPWITGLTYNMTLSNSYNANETGSFYGLKTVNGVAKNGTGDEGYSRGYTVLLDNLVKYNKTFGKHNVDLTMLYSTENSSSVSMATHGEGFDDPSLGYFGLSKGKIQTVSTGGTKTAAVGEMARLTYGYDNRYTITGTIRRDGYSAFSDNHKYGTFPSLGVNWNLSNEQFMKEISVIDALSLRGSYGSNGNQSINPYGTLSRMANGKYYYYGNSSYTYTQYIYNLGNSNLNWESTTGLNLGMDFSILKRRISGSVDWYSKYTTNLMFPLSIPTTSGYSSINSNLGRVGNKGIEVNLSTVNIDRGSFRWKSDFAFSLNRNKLIHVFGPDSTGVEKDLVSQGYFIGKSLGTIYTYKITGMWQVADSTNGTIMQGMRPGTYKILDVNGDGKITSDKDKVFVGNTAPNFRWSMTNTFDYKDFSLMFYIYSIWGGHGYYMASNTPYYDGYANNGSINHAVYDYWTPTNTGAMFPRPNYTNTASYQATKYFDRSFIKLQKVSISYNMTKLVKRYGIQSMTFTLSADNIFTYAPYWKGLDPETGMGLTDSSIPSIRTFSAGLNFNF